MTALSRVRRLRRTIRLLERLLTLDRRDSGGCAGVTLAQCHALLELEESGGAAVGALARQLRLDKSTVSRTVEGVVSIGLVRRSTRLGDRRTAALTLTEQGRRVCRQINAFNDRLFGKVLEGLRPDEAERLLVGFDTFTRALAATVEPPVGPCGGASRTQGGSPGKQRKPRRLARERRGY